jgi:hypothetical protein
MVSVLPGNSPFQGGTKRPLSQDEVSGSFAPFNTSVSRPEAGVDPSQTIFARQNRGSNVPIPYARLVPASGKDTGGLAPSIDNDNTREELRKVVTEIEDLYGTRLAFILGSRSKEYSGITVYDSTTSESIPNPMTSYGYSFGIHNNMAPGLRGVDRFQKLCSFEYLKRYFTNVICFNGFDLKDVQMSIVDCDVGKALLEIAGPNQKDLMENLSFEDLTKIQTLAQVIAAPGSEAQRVVNPSRIGGMQGIVLDFSPFLHGSYDAPMPVNASTDKVFIDNRKRPNVVSSNLGDDLAFSMLEKKLSDIGVTDWRPDGIVLSRNTNDPSDAMNDAMTDARDGALFNVRVQGPALASSWAHDTDLQMLTQDKVFVVIVADVISDTEPFIDFYDKEENYDDLTIQERKNIINKNREIADAINNYAAAVTTDPDQKNTKVLKEYHRAKKKSMFDYMNLMTRGSHLSNTMYELDYIIKMHDSDRLVMSNMRVRLMTSSQMVNFSAMRSGSDLISSKSRLGLKLGRQVSEYIVGGWCIGSVMDCNASRAAMREPSFSGVRTAPNSAAVNLYVNIEWWSGDKMWRTYCNKHTTDNSPGIHARYHSKLPNSHTPSVAGTLHSVFDTINLFKEKHFQLVAAARDILSKLPDTEKTDELYQDINTHETDAFTFINFYETQTMSAKSRKVSIRRITGSMLEWLQAVRKIFKNLKKYQNDVAKEMDAESEGFSDLESLLGDVEDGAVVRTTVRDAVDEVTLPDETARYRESLARLRDAVAKKKESEKNTTSAVVLLAAKLDGESEKLTVKEVTGMVKNQEETAVDERLEEEVETLDQTQIEEVVRENSAELANTTPEELKARLQAFIDQEIKAEAEMIESIEEARNEIKETAPKSNEELVKNLLDNVLSNALQQANVSTAVEGALKAAILPMIKSKMRAHSRINHLRAKAIASGVFLNETILSLQSRQRRKKSSGFASAFTSG